MPGNNGNGRDKTFIRIIQILAGVMVCFGVATLLLTIFGNPSDQVIFRVLSGFGAMFTGMIGLALGYLSGRGEQRQVSEATVPATIDGKPFQRVLGVSQRVGWGQSFYGYAVYIEDGTTRHPRRFAHAVDAILADDRSWIRGGKVSFQRVATLIGTYVILAKPATVDKLCYPLQTEGEVSCCQGNKVVVNVERWKKGVEHWTGRLRPTARCCQPRVRAPNRKAAQAGVQAPDSKLRLCSSRPMAPRMPRELLAAGLGAMSRHAIVA